MIRTRLFICFLAGITLSIKLAGQNLEFYREDILFDIQKDKVVTDAAYYFCNIGDKDIRISLFYPFPGQTIDLIDSLVIEDLKTNEIIPYREAESGVFIGISVKAYGQSAFRVYFRQRLEEDHFLYILKTTKSWGQPLEIANYELQMPLTCLLDSISYLPDTSYKLNDIQYFKWKKTDFMPDRDFEVFFH